MIFKKKNNQNIKLSPINYPNHDYNVKTDDKANHLHQSQGKGK